MKPSILPLICIAAAIVAPFAHADVKLPAIISKHMVLQADHVLPIWGWAEPGEEVSVTLAGQSQSTKANSEGRWMVKLPKLKATAEPQSLTVKGKNTLTVEDVLIGEVWLASGQSNMALKVHSVKNATEEEAAATHPQIRIFDVGGNALREPQTDCRGEWKVCAPDTVANFSAVAYFFGRELNQKLNVPVGLFDSSVGGTDIAAWTSEEAQVQVPELKAQLDEWLKKDAAFDAPAAKAKMAEAEAAYKAALAKAKVENAKAPARPHLIRQPAHDPNCPANLYNGKIAPLIPYALRGVIWYQGEHNAADAKLAPLYRIQLPLLVQDWRARWQETLPFAWVQLPNYDVPGDGRPMVREAMLQALKLPATGMVVTTDIGEAHNNHPKNKQDVGLRLAQWALGTVYGQKVPATSGPLPAGHEVRGSEVALSFTHTDGGLVAKDGDLKGFTVAGADKQWVKATARIDGDRIIVSSPEVKQPIAVRYSWAANPDGNLFNGAGLPASPFRTDGD
jgi:hypothetical protein